MIPSARKAFNASFTDERYNAFKLACQERFNKQIEFKICETPVFVDAAFSKQVIEAGEAIIDQILEPAFVAMTEQAIPKDLYVPGDEGRPTVIALDFGICRDTNGGLIPQLIEMQGFASLYAWQHELGRNYRRFFDVPDDVDHLFGGLDETAYREVLRKAIVADHDPKEVILLEIEPDKQKTWIDFYLTREMLGIEPVCISAVLREGKQLYYMHNGEKRRIKRIYNRLIFDELAGRADLQRQWNLTEEADVEWVCHPNWFFRISKYTLPFIQHASVPQTLFLKDLQSAPTDLENWVLKPLFSFAGHGVIFNITPEAMSNAMQEPENFILQRKVTYAPVVETLDEPAKAELRLMYIWEKDSARPRLVINLARLSKGMMIGVDFNRNKTWVGGTVGYYAVSGDPDGYRE